MEDKIRKEMNERFVYALNSVKQDSLYFAHPIDVYGTPLQARLIEKIEKDFPEYSVENPNQLHHDSNYGFWREHTESGMTYFTEFLKYGKIAGEIFLPFEDGMIGAGVAKEIKRVQGLGKKIFEIDRTGEIIPVKNLDESRILSVPDTKARVHPKK